MNSQSAEHTLNPSLLDHYAKHSSLLYVNLIEYVSNFSMYRGDLCKRPLPVIVRSFPQHPANPHGERCDHYCKYQLIKYKPWQGQPSHAWDDVEDTDNNCIRAYHRFLATPSIEAEIPLFAQELDRAEQYLRTLRVKKLQMMRMLINGCFSAA